MSPPSLACLVEDIGSEEPWQASALALVSASARLALVPANPQRQHPGRAGGRFARLAACRGRGPLPRARTSPRPSSSPSDSGDVGGTLRRPHLATLDCSPAASPSREPLSLGTTMAESGQVAGARGRRGLTPGGGLLSQQNGLPLPSFHRCSPAPLALATGFFPESSQGEGTLPAAPGPFSFSLSSFSLLLVGRRGRRSWGRPGFFSRAPYRASYFRTDMPRDILPRLPLRRASRT